MVRVDQGSQGFTARKRVLGQKMGQMKTAQCQPDLLMLIAKVYCRRSLCQWWQLPNPQVLSQLLFSPQSPECMEADHCGVNVQIKRLVSFPIHNPLQARIQNVAMVLWLWPMGQ